jgi:hypothetical protein
MSLSHQYLQEVAKDIARNQQRMVLKKYWRCGCGGCGTCRGFDVLLPLQQLHAMVEGQRCQR